MTGRLACALLCLLAAVGVRAERLAGVDPKSASLSVIDGNDVYLSIEYFAWGPDWSGVTRKAKVVGTSTSTTFVISNHIKRSSVDFSVKGSWTQPKPGTLSLDAELTAEGESEIVMAQFGLVPGATFAGGRIAVQDSAGNHREFPIPAKRGVLGEDIRELVLTDSAGATNTIRFKEPVRVSADKRQLRMVLAKGSINPESKPRISFELSMSQTARLIPDIAATSTTSAVDDWYEFKVPDRIPDDSVWQMRDWLEKPAGKHGRILRQGDKLMYNGAPIKLWGITDSYDNCAPDAALADKRADFYSALGINAVRLHKFADGPGWQGISAEGSHTQFDPAKLDRMDYFVAALKKQGIYVNLSPVFIVGIGPDDRSRVPYMDEFGPMQNHRIDPKHGSFYISTELQDLQIQQVVNLLNHRNPYTGLRYADDPAVAYLEMYNEDSALFGGVTTVMAKSATQRERTGRRFANWLEARYKTENAFMEAWGPRALNSNVVSNGKLPTDESWREKRIYPAGNPWFFDPTNLDSTQRHIKRRLLDTMLFLYETQNEVYARYQKAIRATGYSGELIASNWQAGRMMSHFYNLHSDALIGTIDRHNYFGGGKKGSIASRLNPPSMLNEPGSGILSASMQQVDGLPFMLSEWIHVDQNPWTAEGPAIVGAYGFGLQGWDAAFSFQNGDQGTFSNGAERKRWDATAPSFAGMLPAVSRQIHRSDVKEAGEAHYRRVNIRALESGHIGFQESIARNGDEKEFLSDAFPVQLLARERTLVAFSTVDEPTSRAPYSEEDGSEITSATGELTWRGRHGEIAGLVTINTAHTKAIIGDAGGNMIRLGDVSFKPTNRFAAVYLTTLGAPGTASVKGPFLLTLIGRTPTARRNRMAPPLMERVSAEISFAGGLPDVFVQALDSGGAPVGRRVEYHRGAVIKFDSGKTNSPYYEITLAD